MATASAESRPVCTKGDAAAALGPLSALPAAELIAKLGTNVEPYYLQDGTWLSQAPIVVNEPFDFAQAMGLGAIGAGLAAGTRQKNNAARAAQLGPRTLDAEVLRYLESLRACGIHRWVLAWGGEKPETRVVTERYDAAGKRVDTTERVLDGNVAFDRATWMDTPPTEGGEVTP